MSDPLERLSALRGGLDVDTMPPAHEVRRRGDRRRTRARAAMAGAAVAVAAAIVAPVLALTPGEDHSGPLPADPSITPTETPSGVPTPTPTPEAMSEADLLTDAETVYNEGSDWVAAATHTSVPAETIHPCARAPLGRLGSLQELQRGFVMHSPGFEGTSTNTMTETIARFEDPATARAAYDTLAGWVADCQGPVNDYRVTGPTTVDTGVGGEARVYVATESVGLIPEDPDAGNFIETGLVVVGDRVAVITSTVVGQDYNFPDGTPVERMVPAAAALLLPGVRPGSSTSTEEPSGGSTAGPTTGATGGASEETAPTLTESLFPDPAAVPAIPHGGWQRAEDSGAATIACQGSWLRELGPTERISAEYVVPGTEGTYDLGRLRVAVLAFDDLAAAEEAYATARSWMRDCPATHAPAGTMVREPVTPVQPGASEYLAGFDVAHEVDVTYPAPEACGGGDCDATWFEAGTIGRFGTRLVLVGQAELAGPCLPGPGNTCEGDAEVEPYRQRIRDIATAVGTAATADLR